MQGEVGTGKDSVGGRQWAWVMLITTFCSLISATFTHGGFQGIADKAADMGILKMPRFGNIVTIHLHQPRFFDTLWNIYQVVTYL